jgi:hypothetical protein
MSVLDRFWAKVNAPSDGCWQWVGCINAEGYGRFNFDGVITNAHRASYRLFVGEIPPGLVIDHLCRNRSCVNPDHLELVTNKENILRGVGAGAQAARMIECPKGHPLDEDNTYVAPGSKKRRCRSCVREYGRARRARVAA